MGFAEWWQGLERRLSRSCSVLRLGHRNLYISLSRFGCLWLLTAGALYLLGTQAASNTPVLLALLMVSLQLLSLFLTHLNLQGLQVEALQQEACCVGDNHAYRVESSSTIWRPSLQWRWIHPTSGRPQALTIHPGKQQHVLPWRGQQRGRHRPGRLLLWTTAPLGLFRCWTYWEPGSPIWVAPERCPGPVQELNCATDRDGDLIDSLQPWRPEQGWQRVDWKAKARGRGWVSKAFQREQDNALWLAPSAQLPLEQALGHLCDRLWQELHRGRPTGLVLPDGSCVPPKTGSAQLQLCLMALAEWPP